MTDWTDFPRGSSRSFFLLISTSPCTSTSNLSISTEQTPPYTQTCPTLPATSPTRSRRRFRDPVNGNQVPQYRRFKAPSLARASLRMTQSQRPEESQTLTSTPRT
ncbi:hypothetical protein P389DRAFT_208613 [Cystobasidium minutum MCA 4210]|uniref:uncharacterized protein n=1 Tax=Cystobasidium minutum MCA 4210 TaxID=1397322 RepID=UPI0034CD99C3|eukprot:jgi/Rhomi1/208613/estExt_Genemark1.C_2_t10316